MTDWLMVIITAVYVVATIAICYFNAKSAKAAKDQLEESKKQYKEQNRLSIMPLLQVYEAEQSDFANNKGIILHFVSGGYNQVTTEHITLKNIGLGNAKSICYSCTYSDNDYTNNELLPVSVLAANDRLNISLSSYKNNILTITFEFQDLLDNRYVQKVEIDNRIGQKAIRNFPMERIEESNV